MDVKIFCYFFTLLTLALLLNGNPVPEGQSGKHVLCYFEGVSAKNPHEEVRFVPEDLDLNICTHVVYNRALVGTDLHVEPRVRDVDLREDDGLGLFNRTVALKERKPALKVILDLYDENGVLENEMANNNSESLTTFAKNVVDFIKTRGFDGVNFRIHIKGFAETVPFLREELSREGFLLMTALMPKPCGRKEDKQMTEELSRNFDVIVVGSYMALPTDETVILSSNKELENKISHYAASGIPLEKLVVPIPAFSLSLELCSQQENAISSSVCGAGDEGIYDVSEPMVLYHSQVLRKIANATEEWVVTRDEESGVLYGYSKSRQWASFEDPVSVRAKAALVLERNLAGIAIMNNDMEDFKGAYTENGETFPLTRAAYNAFYGES